MIDCSPLCKQDDKMDKAQYSPISVLVCQSKAFEVIMVDQMTQFMNDKLCESLLVYRTYYSTQHALLYAIEEQKVALDDGQHVGVVLLNLSKVFDAIPHVLLLNKLYTYGISSDICDMIQIYLINRMQRVKLVDVRHSWKCAIHGLPFVMISSWSSYST